MTDFTILSGPDRGKTFALGEKPFKIGRGQDQDLVLADDRSSKEHAVIETRGGKVVVRDLESSNGTFVNGDLIEEVELREGDVVRIGHTEFRYGAPRRGGPVPTAPIRLEAYARADEMKRQGIGGKTQAMTAQQIEEANLQTLVQTPEGPVDNLVPDTPIAPPAGEAPDNDGRTVGVADRGEEESSAVLARPEVSSSISVETLDDLARALRDFVEPVAAAKRIALEVDASARGLRVALPMARAFVALAEVMEISVLLLSDERHCKLRARRSSEDCAALSLIVGGGIQPSERAVFLLAGRRFGEASFLASRCGGDFLIAPEPGPDVAWRFRAPLSRDDLRASGSSHCP